MSIQTQQVSTFTTEFVVADEWADVKFYDITLVGKQYRTWTEAERWYIMAHHTGAVNKFYTQEALHAFTWALTQHMLQGEYEVDLLADEPTAADLEAVKQMNEWEPAAYDDEYDLLVEEDEEYYRNVRDIQCAEHPW